MRFVLCGLVAMALLIGCDGQEAQAQLRGPRGNFLFPGIAAFRLNRQANANLALANFRVSQNVAAAAKFNQVAFVPFKAVAVAKIPVANFAYAPAAAFAYAPARNSVVYVAPPSFAASYYQQAAYAPAYTLQAPTCNLHAPTCNLQAPTCSLTAPTFSQVSYSHVSAAVSGGCYAGF